jgi:phosphoglycolate phosphatase/beta-phosphoglucomutase
MARLLDLHRPTWDPKDYDLNDLARRKNVFYLELAKKGLQTYPGVPEGLQWLRSQGIRTAVVSNGKRNELEKTMKHLDLFDLFDQVISRDDAKSSKPDPAPYLLGAALLEVEPHECLAIEDSPTGLEAALFARIPSAAVLTNFPRQALETPVPGRPDLKPRWIFNSIQEFFAWLMRS